MTASAAPTASARLVARDLALAYDGRPVVEHLDLAIPDGRVTVIVGPNGCGKSTVLRGLARLLPASSGAVELDGTDIRRIAPRRLALQLGLLPQQPVAPEDILVADLVARGRYPRQGALRRWSPEDERVVEQSLVATGTLELAGRRVSDLSGGQRQRVWIAMALAQEPEILLLDEPTTFLDVAHQVELLDVLHERNRGSGTTVVMVLHDLDLAARYADHLVVMAGGRVLAEGAPGEVLDAALVREAFGLESLVVPDPVSGSPMVVPAGRFHPLPDADRL